MRLQDLTMHTVKYEHSFQAIDELLNFHCDPSLPLTHGVGSALCAATSTEYEYRRKNISQRLHLVSIKLLFQKTNLYTDSYMF